VAAVEKNVGTQEFSLIQIRPSKKENESLFKCPFNENGFRVNQKQFPLSR
jgi:hypothetical protein